MTAERRMRLISWRRQRGSRPGSTLVGFASIELPIGLEIAAIPVCTKGSSRWASLPARLVLDAVGQTLRDDRGKNAYVKIIRWQSDRRRQAFSDRVCDLVAEVDPAAFDEGGP
jgi:hypothetical protein